MDPFQLLIGGIYGSGLLRAPHLRLAAPKLVAPPAMAVFGLVLLSYFLVTGGIIYDIIVEPPGMGSTQDPRTGQHRPAAFLPGRISGQYIIEGLSASFLFVLGGLGLIMLDWATDKVVSRRYRQMYFWGGVVCCAIAYNMSMVFLRIKVPGYLSGFGN